MASRVLADGSAIVVADGGAFLTILRHDRAGNLLSSASVFSSSAYGRSVAIDAFGGVFVGETYQTSSGYEFEAMKYDGASGRRMWAAPVSIPADADTGAVPQYVFSTPSGDLLLVSPKSILLDGATGRVRWGPAGPAVASPIAVAFDREGGVAVSGTTLWTESEPPAYLTFKLSAPAKVTVRLLRGKRVVKTINVSGKAGTNTVALKKLKRFAYTVQLSAPGAKTVSKKLRLGV